MRRFLWYLRLLLPLTGILVTGLMLVALYRRTHPSPVAFPATEVLVAQREIHDFSAEVASFSSRVSELPLPSRPVAISWYGGEFQGQPTASGYPFDRWANTCASRTLPLGTWIRLRSSRGQVAYARVTDRGPWVKDKDGRYIRDLDVSQEVARELHLLSAGVARVHMTVLGREPR
jgi:rare lipoprotein A